MKYSMIKYQFANGATEDWHREVSRFVAALDGDPDLKGRISYRVMKNRDDATSKLALIVRAALDRPKPRKPTKVSRGAKRRRVADKRHKSEIKRNRSGTDD